MIRRNRRSRFPFRIAAVAAVLTLAAVSNLGFAGPGAGEILRIAVPD